MDLASAVGRQVPDGTPLNANAVVFNLQRWWDPAHPYHQGDFIYFRALFGYRGDPNWLDPGHLCLRTVGGGHPVDVPNNTILSSLALPFFSIASPAAIQAGTLASTPVGTGPFRFVRWTPGVSVEMAANADHWRGAPRSSTLVFRVIPNAADRLAALQAGTVQVANDVAGPAADPQLRVLSRTGLNVGYVGINHDHAPLGNLLVRQAIAHAVDKQHIRAVAYPGSVTMADQFLPYGLWGRDPSIVDYNYDPVLARSLLAQAGYTSGITTTLSYRSVPRGYMPDPQAVAQTIQADMAAAGIHLVVNVYEFRHIPLPGLFRSAGPVPVGLGSRHAASGQLLLAALFRPAGFGAVDTELSDQLAIARSTPDLTAKDVIYRWASPAVSMRHCRWCRLPTAVLRSPRASTLPELSPRRSPARSYRDARVVGAAYANVTPANGALLSFTDGNAHPTSALVPSAAVTQPTTFHLIETDIDFSSHQSALRPSRPRTARVACSAQHCLTSPLPGRSR